jgi:hypothetical protein
MCKRYQEKEKAINSIWSFSCLEPANWGPEDALFVIKVLCNYFLGTVFILLTRCYCIFAQLRQLVAI